MADTVQLVTDLDARERFPDAVSRAYVAQDGSVVSGGQVSQMIAGGLGDTSALRQEQEQAQERSSGSGLGGIESLAMLFMEYKLISKLTKADKSFFKSALAFAAAGTLQAMHILPASFQPLLQAAAGAAAGAVGGSSQAGAALGRLAGICPDDGGELARTAAAISEGDDFLERDAGDRTTASAEARVKAIYVREFGEDILTTGAGDTPVEELKEYMSANGKLMAEDGVFASCANKAGADREFAGMRTVTSCACGVLEADLEAGGKSAKDLYLKMAEGLAAYESGAREGFLSGDPAKAAQAEEGLSKVMEASRGPVIASVKAMQDKYALFSGDDMARLRELLPGFDGDGLEYDLAAALAADELDAAAYMPDESILNAYKQEEPEAAKLPAPAAPRTGLDLSRIKAGTDAPGFQVEI